MTTRQILPKTDGVGNIGSVSRFWRTIFVNRLTFSDGTYMENATDYGLTPAITNEFDTGWINIVNSDGTGSATGLYTGAHGLGEEPKFFTIAMSKRLHNHPDSWHDEDIIYDYGPTGYYTGWAIKFDSTNYYIRASNNMNLVVLDRYGGGRETLTEENWDFRVLFYA